MRPNWFVALRVRAPSVRLAPPPPGVRLFDHEDLHATIAFLGAVGEVRAHRAWDATQVHLSPRTIALGRVVPLGASALSALVHDGELTAAIGASRDAVHRAADTPADPRPVLAHVTLARFARRADREAGIAWAADLRLGDVAARVEDVALYTWAADRSVRLFRIVARRAL